LENKKESSYSSKGTIVLGVLFFVCYGELMNKLLNKEKGVSVCILPECDKDVSEYGYLCSRHIRLAGAEKVKIVVCDNCGSPARYVVPTYNGFEGNYWRDRKRKKYVFCQVCRGCGSTKDEEIYSTYDYVDSVDHMKITKEGKIII